MGIANNLGKVIGLSFTVKYSQRQRQISRPKKQARIQGHGVEVKGVPPSAGNLHANQHPQGPLGHHALDCNQPLCPLHVACDRLFNPLAIKWGL